jgi:hypothetical protein
MLSPLQVWEIQQVSQLVIIVCNTLIYFQTFHSQCDRVDVTMRNRKGADQF